MPWTFAHPAAVLPLRALCGPRGLWFPALAVGAISPDLCYYVGRFDFGALTHTPLGVLLFCVPAGWLALLALRALQGPAALLLPAPHAAALGSIAVLPPGAAGARAFATVSLSLAIGAATHVVWDAFTHEYQYFVQRFEFLRAPLFPLLGRQVRVYGLLQYLSSIVGVALLGVAYARYARPFRSAQRDGAGSDAARSARIFAGLGVASLLCAALVVFAEMHSDVFDPYPYRIFVRLVTYAATAFFVLLPIAAAIRVRVTRNAPADRYRRSP